MVRYIIISLVCGIIFGILDGVINANPYARKIFKVYSPIARTSINAAAGIIIDIVYGFIIGFIFLILYEALPGGTGLIKGISFGLIIWFFRVLMSAATNWMMFKVPAAAVFYSIISGLAEMMILGSVYGLFIKPF